jgi:hypothetical protein
MFTMWFEAAHGNIEAPEGKFEVGWIWLFPSGRKSQTFEVFEE